VIAAYRYAEPLSGLIQGYKFNQRLQNGRLLAGLMLRQLVERLEPLPELLIPVPLHTSRVRERGFNQSKELGQLLGRKLGMPMDYSIVRRCRATQAQTGLSAKERQHNIKGAFEVIGQVSARRVALVDDVMTTGSTVNELARCLKRSGVHEVEVWVVARAV
jgi:ComF family protein